MYVISLLPLGLICLMLVACTQFEKRYTKQDFLMDNTITTTASSPTLCSLVAKAKGKYAFKWEESGNRCLLFDNVPGIGMKKCINL